MRFTQKTEQNGKVAEKRNTEGGSVPMESDAVCLSDLVDINQLTPILEDFCNAVGVASAIIDLEGNILASARWQRICTGFHRMDKRTQARCIESDTVLAAHLEEGKGFSVYHCRNGLTDAASPIVIRGRHVANIFVGQFLLDEPDREHFRRQAEEFGFDTEAYLQALDEVPILSSGKLESILGFLTGFTRLVASLGLERLKAREAENVCKVRAEDIEMARKELAEYKEHLEIQVAERTQKLQESEEYIRLILQSAAEGIFGTDLEGRCTFANDAALKMLGYALDEIIDRPIHDLFHHSNPDGSPHPREQCPIYLSYTQGITSFRRDEVFWRKDGTFLDVSYTSVPQLRGVTIIGSVVVFRDISARKKAEDALRESEYHLKTILTTTNEGFWWVNNDARTLDVNNTFCQLLGRQREDILGRTVFEFLDEENTLIMKEQLRRRAAGETSVYEIALSRPEGSKVLCLFHATPLYDKNGVKTGSFAMISDITQRKRMEEELIIARDKAEAATRAKSDFLANMSHEIRTPMNAVLGMTHLVLKTELTPKQQDYINKIQISANALLGVINDILDFSKIEAGKLNMESISFDLEEVLNNLATLMTVKVQEKEGIEVLFSTDDEVPRQLVGDPLRLSQVLINLANNAIKFTDRGEIVVSTTLVNRARRTAVLQFSVRDTGIGISEDQMAQLFTSFSQGDTSITRKYGGTGLGLTICQRLVKMMGGRIWVESVPGEGSTFYFTAVFGTEPEVEGVCHVPPPGMRGIKALVVDDNPTSREIFQRMLESFSFEVFLAASGEEGLEEIENSIRTRPYDLVIMDWKMPGIDGIEAARRIRGNPRLTRLPLIVMVSAYGREELLWRAEAAGLDGFLVKPVSPSVMFDTIVSAMNKDAARKFTPEGKEKQTPDVLERLRGVKVLIVEDNDINQMVATEILAGAGVVSSVAHNGQEAVEMVRRDRYDAVLMDVQMPVMDGYTATRVIRQDPNFKDLPIIAMTAHAMAGDHERSTEAGMNDHITKPIDPAQLYETLVRWISKADAPAEAGPVPGETPESPDAAAEAEDRATSGFSGALPASLEGFDLAEGLRRLQGNTALYRKLLMQFAANYPQKTDAVRQALDAEDYPEAHRILHDIKGLAGNLAANALQAAAAALEKLAKHADPGHPPAPGEVAQAFSDFETRMAQALESVRTLQPRGAEPDIEPSAGSAEALTPALAREAAARLREAAEVGDVSGLAAIAEEMASRSRGFTPYLGRIRQLADDFDFDGILGLADDLEKMQG